MTDSKHLNQNQSNKTLGEIATLIQGSLQGDPDLQISGACGIHEAKSGEITYVSDPKLIPQLKKSKASAVILSPEISFGDMPSISIQEPAKAFLQVLSLWGDANHPLQRKGTDPSAIIGDEVVLGKNVYLGPGVVVGKGARIGDGCSILANSVIGENCELAENTLIYENVTVRENSRIDARVILHPGVVIGGDGFGYETVDGAHVKVPQRGNVWLAEDVEIGANSCVDRARFGTTVIGRGTKIDNLVQIAHNVQIGEGCLIVSQAGIAGSSQLGNYVVLAGQVGVVNHVTIGDKVQIGAQSGVNRSIPANSIVLGSPPKPIREEKSLLVYRSRLPELFKEVRELKEKIKSLENTSSS